MTGETKIPTAIWLSPNAMQLHLLDITTGRVDSCMFRKYRKSGRFPGGGTGSPLQCSCLGKSHRERNLAGYSPWDRKESDTMIDQAQTHTHVRAYLFRVVITGWEVAYIIPSDVILSSFSSSASPLRACWKIIFLYSSR